MIVITAESERDPSNDAEDHDGKRLHCAEIVVDDKDMCGDPTHNPHRQCEEFAFSSLDTATTALLLRRSCGRVKDKPRQLA
jgi:hypothetical protein